MMPLARQISGSTMSLLGIVLGLNHCRAVAISEDGLLRCETYREYKGATQSKTEHTADIRGLWLSLRDLLGEVGAACRKDPINALAVTSIGEAVVPLSSEGRILGCCLLGSSPRGQDYTRQIEDDIGRERAFALSGRILSTPNIAGRLCWLRDHQPELYRQTWRFASPGGLAGLFLGGSSASDYSLASGTALLDITQRKWSDRLIDSAGLSHHKLPDLAPAASRIGMMAASLARELGLPTRINLVLGGHDLACNALGAGVVGPDRAVYNLSTTMHLVPSFNAIPLTSLMLKAGLIMEPHVVPDLFVTSLYNPSGGLVLQWYCDQLARMEKLEAQRHGASFYAELLAEMPSEPTDLMVLPHFIQTGPPLFDADSAGVIIGLRADTTRGALVKGLLEGISYQMAEGQEMLERVGLPIETYRATGGGARSSRWLQLTADVLGTPLESPTLPDAPAIGAAMLAGIGCGTYDSAQQAVDVVVRVSRRYEPDMAQHHRYESRLARYRELYPLLRDYLHRLHTQT